MNTHFISPKEQAHMHHTSEVLGRLLPTLHSFNQAMVSASQKLMGRPAKQSLMGLAMHGQQCENELVNVVRQYKVDSPVNAQLVQGDAEVDTHDAIAYALTQEKKIDGLYAQLIADQELDNSVLQLLKHQAQHLRHQFSQLRFLHGCMPQLGMTA